MAPQTLALLGTSQKEKSPVAIGFTNCGLSHSSNMMNPWKGHILTAVAISTLGLPACVQFERQNCKQTTGPIRNSEPNYVPNELLVRFHEGVSESRIQELHDSLGVQVLRRTPPLRLYRVETPPGTPMNEIRKAYLLLPEVESVDMNYKAFPD